MARSSQSMDIYNKIILALSKEDYRLAGLFLEEARLKNPHDPQSWYLSGVLFHKTGNLVEARESLVKAVSICPEFSEAYNSLGCVYKDLGEFKNSEKAFSNAIGESGGSAELYANRSDLFRQMEAFERAIRDCNLAIKMNRKLPAAHGNLGAIQIDLGEWLKAEKSLRTAIKLDSRNLSFYVNLSKTMISLQKPDDALKVAQNAVRLEPTSSHAINALANCYLYKSEFHQAEVFYRQALGFNPRNIDVLNNLGTALAHQNNLSKAYDNYKRALYLDPNRADILTNLGSIDYAFGNFVDAKGCFDKALKLAPNYADAKWNLGITLLLSGDFTNGFAYYEARLDLPEFSQKLSDITTWTGQSLKGKVIRVESEQGYGDTIQFVRFLPELKKLGAKTILSIEKPLEKLFQCMKAVHQIDVTCKHRIKADYRVSLMSLPHLLGVTIDKIPNVIPYLHLVGGAKPKVQASADLKVGIVWSGNLSHRHGWAQNRSIPFDDLEVLFSIQGVVWYSLQFETPDSSLSNKMQDLGIKDMSNYILSFSDTADIISDLDLVITIDSAVAHLAGALGIPVWVMLSFVPDWRWLLEREDTPWYQTMSLFRQKKRGVWNDVVEAVSIALSQKIILGN